MNKKITLSYQEIPDTELSSVHLRMKQLALEAAGRAYAPYSHFQVGAAVLLEDGTLVSGNNQENAAYPSGLCAERVALFYASAQYPNLAVQAIAVIAVANGEVQEAISPCGACCQVLVESEQKSRHPLSVLLCGKEKNRLLHGVSSLLPFSFTASAFDKML